MDVTLNMLYIVCLHLQDSHVEKKGLMRKTGSFQVSLPWITRAEKYRMFDATAVNLLLLSF